MPAPTTLAIQAIPRIIPTTVKSKLVTKFTRSPTDAKKSGEIIYTTNCCSTFCVLLEKYLESPTAIPIKKAPNTPRMPRYSVNTAPRKQRQQLTVIKPQEPEMYFLASHNNLFTIQRPMVTINRAN